MEDFKNINKKISFGIIIVSIMIFFVYMFSLHNITNVKIINNKEIFISLYNILLCILSVSSCVALSSKNKNKHIVLVSIMYATFLIDMFTSSISSIDLQIDQKIYVGIGTATLRFFIGVLCILPKGIIDYIYDNNLRTILFTSTYNFILLIITSYSNYDTKHFLEISNYIEYNLLSLICFTIAAIVFFYKSIKENNYLLSIIGSSILIFSTKAIYSIYHIRTLNDEIKLISISITYVGFLILIIGIFMELTFNLIKYESIKKDEKIKSEFFANMSHELKTPINIIYSTNQLLAFSKNKNNFNEIYSRYDSVIDTNCKRMIRLVNNIVDISKFESKFKKPNYKNYNIVWVVESIVMSIADYAKMKNIDVLFDTDSEELNIKCDPEIIERIILNLLSNSIKFSKENNEIFVDISHNDKYIIIKVKDSGIGIKKELQSEIFDRFVQGDKSLIRENEGSGIGLSIVKSMVDVLDGKIELFSDGINGCEFTVYLPNKILEDENLIIKEYCFDVTKMDLEFSDIY
ncbi:MAG: HAMP domain-containing sensor histidine kinase [Peptostreptococcaceae bacterium]